MRSYVRVSLGLSLWTGCFVDPQPEPDVNACQSGELGCACASGGGCASGLRCGDQGLCESLTCSPGLLGCACLEGGCVPPLTCFQDRCLNVEGGTSSGEASAGTTTDVAESGSTTASLWGSTSETTATSLETTAGTDDGTTSEGTTGHGSVAGTEDGTSGEGDTTGGATTETTRGTTSSSTTGDTLETSEAESETSSSSGGEEPCGCSWALDYGGLYACVAGGQSLPDPSGIYPLRCPELTDEATFCADVGEVGCCWDSVTVAYCSDSGLVLGFCDAQIECGFGYYYYYEDASADG